MGPTKKLTPLEFILKLLTATAWVVVALLLDKKVPINVAPVKELEVFL